MLPEQSTAQQTSDSLTASAKYIARKVKQLLTQSSSQNQKTHFTDKIYSEAQLLSAVKQVEAEEGEELTERERTAILAMLSASQDHYDVLTPLINNAEVNDIIIRAYNDISVQKGRINFQTDLSFTDADTYRAFIENLLKRAGKACTTATPIVDVAIDVNIRACVTHSSFSPHGSGPLLTLRISRHPAISLNSLIHHGLAPQAIFDYLNPIVSSGAATVLIAGEVSTGKTTLLRALASCIPESEAILIIEDTHELLLERRFVRTLLTRESNTEGFGKISPALAIRTGMRMAMNRLILGEIRDAEAAEAFIDVCASGHSGMSTIHARSARDSAHRLEIFLSRAQSMVGINTIRRQIANAVTIIIHLGIDKAHSKRRIMEVAEVSSCTDGNLQLSPIFRFTPQGGKAIWRRESGITAFSTILSEAGVHATYNGNCFLLETEDLFDKPNSYKQC